MSYAETTESRVFLTQSFNLSVAPGLWILTSTDVNGYQTISFSSCSFPSIYLSSGVCYWYHHGSDSCCTINWLFCNGPTGALPPFPWGANVPTYLQLITYLRENRQPGPCEGGGGSMSNIYTTNGLLEGDRTVDFGDKYLLFHPSLNGSWFAISRDGGAFPPITPNQLVFRFDPDDFLGTTKPGLVFGYQNTPGGSGGDSAAIQISQVTGQKGVMTTSIDEANGKFVTQMINDDKWEASVGNVGSTALIRVEAGNVYIDGIPNTTTTDILYWDNGSKRLSYGAIPTPVVNNALFRVNTQALMNIPLLAVTQIPCSGTVFSVPSYGYNNSGLELDLTLGTYSPSQTFIAEVTATFLMNSTLNSNFGFMSFFNVTDNIEIGGHNWIIRTSENEQQTFICRVRLEAAKTYCWRIATGVGTGVVQMVNGQFSINKV